MCYNKRAPFREAGFTMRREKHSKMKLMRAVFGCFLVLIGIFGGLMGIVSSGEKAFAEPTGEVVTDNREDTGNERTNEADGSDGANENKETDVKSDDTEEVTEAKTGSGDSCQDSLGAIGWLVCPTTGKIAEAVDWLYEKIEDILVINPVSSEDGSPIYEVWKYCRGVTNIVFIIFLLIVIYSQITGVGISNYGVKKALPKLIIAAVLVNLSFLICSLAVDASNIIGSSLRGVFTSVEESVLATSEMPDIGMPYTSIYTSLAGGTALAVGAGFIAFETGAIWLLIPVVLGAIVAVASGLITIALRQAVVALLIMIAPLAIVAYILPNTEDLFKKWRKLLTKMLVFYPMFSLLFGASSLAGFAIIMSAKDGFGLILGAAVQVFPLFFSWSLMRMSGTFLGDINTRIRGLAAKPVAANREWANSHRQLARARTLSSEKGIYTPSRSLMRFMENRKVARAAELKELGDDINKRGLAYYRGQRYSQFGKRKGQSNWRGMEAAERVARGLAYDEIISRDDNNIEKGLSTLEVNKKSARLAELKGLDGRLVVASDRLKMEKARGAMIELENARGFHQRISSAMDAHMDLETIKSGDKTRAMHDGALNSTNLARYNDMMRIMEGKEVDVHFVGADAAHAFSAQAQIARNKFRDYFDLTVPTQDVVRRLEELTKNKQSSEYIDPVIAGLGILNKRGDTDLIREQIANIMKDKKIELGTYASQSLASFLMFDVKGSDPTLRRLGKYLNLETAAMYNDTGVPGKRRTKKSVSLDEYMNGEYIDEDEEGNVIYEDGKPKIRKVKRGAKTLLKGTSFKDMERTAIANMTEMIRQSSVDLETGEFDYEKFKKNEKEIWDAIMPNVISDHFSYLSGSEQIMAFGKGITGVDAAKHQFDWEGIFGEELAGKLTPEQKKDYIEFLNKRTKTFLGGQVPSQIAKTKSDMLESIRNQYALRDLIEENEEAIEKDPELLDKLINKVSNKMTDDEYKEFEKEHLDNVKQEFVGSFKKDALKGFVKMHHKGYQGEAKDGLIQLLNPDELYKEFFPNGENSNKNKRQKRQNFDEDEDDGRPVVEEEFYGDTGALHNSVSEAIGKIYEGYRGAKGGDVEEFWQEVKSILAMSSEMQIGIDAIASIEEVLPQFTNVGALYSYIMDKLFGGF